MLFNIIHVSLSLLVRTKSLTYTNHAIILSYFLSVKESLETIVQELASTVQRFLQFTYLLGSKSLNPRAKANDTSSSKSTNKNALLTSFLMRILSLVGYNSRKILHTCHLGNQSKVSLKSNPFTCLSPRIINHALYLSMLPSVLYST